MNRVVIPVLYVAIALAFLGSLFAQCVVVPGAIADEAAINPLVAYFRVPLTVIGILGIVCAQVVLLSMAMLLTKAWGDEIFSARAFRWVDAVIGATLAAALLAFVVFVMQVTAPASTDPEGMTSTGLMLAGAAATAMAVSAALVLLVMRGLLRKATVLKDELAQVV